MCTLVILKEADQIIATMNRDDTKSRFENPIKKFDNIFAPVDIVSGGTWIGLNENNVAGFLLNRYDDYQPKNKFSRGKITLDILANGDFKLCKNFIKNNFNPENYLPFTFILLSSDKLLKCDWNGVDIEFENLEFLDHYILTSSSFNEKEVKKYRHNAFDKWQKDGKEKIKNIPKYNFFQEKNKKDYGVFVERNNVCTLSITQIFLNKESSTMKYFDIKEIKELYGNI